MLRFKLIQTFTLKFIFLLLIGCGTKTNKKENQQPQLIRGSYQSNILGIVEIKTSDAYTRPVGNGFGFFVDKEIVITNLDIIKVAYRAKISAPGTTQYYEVKGYTNYNLNQNLVLLKVERKNENFIPIVEPIINPDSLYTLLRPQRDLYVSKSAIINNFTSDSIEFYLLKSELEPGKPAFFSDHALAGIIQKMNFDTGSSCFGVIGSKYIAELLSTQHPPKSIIGLSTKSNKVYISHYKVQGFRVNTTMGSFTIRLHNETPEYRDNFIKLVSDNYYDSLLIHRVIKNFLIQTGAADTRNAKRDDVVGWQGPGYSLPMNIVKGIFHRRGAIAASKLPGERNPRNYSDGAQFYVVCGRLFDNTELDELEKQKKMKFSAEQRKVYTTIGGAPYLDNDYTVFGEVISGMDVVDKISGVKVYNVDRPETDIRIISIDIIRK